VGGWLHYTVYGLNPTTYKVTVECQTVGYTAGALSVDDNNIVAGGSAIGTLGTGPGSAVSITSTAADFVTSIDGTDTYTGTGAAEGVQVNYTLGAVDAGVASATVLYTIVSE
jgi:hypothetical protein